MRTRTQTVLMACQVHADAEGFIDVAAAKARCGLDVGGFRAELVELVKADIVRSANRVRGVVGPMPETGFQIAEQYR